MLDGLVRMMCAVAQARRPGALEWAWPRARGHSFIPGESHRLQAACCPAICQCVRRPVRQFMSMVNQLFCFRYRRNAPLSVLNVSGAEFRQYASVVHGPFADMPPLDNRKG